jgi:hypothetical protein
MAGDSPSGRARASQGSRPTPVPGMDFGFLLKGYAWFVEKREAVFGRPYGTRMVDRHVYVHTGDPDAAYMAFLQDKISEGFVPRADLIGDLPRGVTLMPLDTERLDRAWRSMA